MGCEYFTDPPVKTTPNEGCTRSLFFPDVAIFSGHPRFKTLSRNIRQRRGQKVAMNLPSESFIMKNFDIFWNTRIFISYKVIFSNTRVDIIGILAISVIFNVLYNVVSTSWIFEILLPFIIVFFHLVVLICYMYQILISSSRKVCNILVMKLHCQNALILMLW